MSPFVIYPRCREVQYLVQDMEDAREALNILLDAETRRQVAVDRIYTALSFLNDVPVLEQWEKDQEKRHETELDTNRESQSEEIVVHLQVAGWTDEIAEIKPPHSLYDHKAFKKPQKITDRIWKNIEPSLTTFMESMKELRIRRIKEETFSDHAPIAIQFL
ncbi:hypothetical protein B0H10DRAFT_2224828 [Mycena sp. CBHHK59/15]|nr:hypothetical protein B0H10DRAFT_2224828 [Mycena sp. CBHHK59/15]